MRLASLTTALFLAACKPGTDVVARYDDWTGFRQLYTAEHEVFRDRKAIMVVRPVIIERNGTRA